MDVNSNGSDNLQEKSYEGEEMVATMVNTDNRDSFPDDDDKGDDPPMEGGWMKYMVDSWRFNNRWHRKW